MVCVLGLKKIKEKNVKRVWKDVVVSGNVWFCFGCFGGNAEETVFVIVELDDFSVCELEGEDLICHEFIGFMAY